MTVEPSVVLVEGPWRHRVVSANGTRLHIAEAGDAHAPLVLLVHGFPQFWWSWRRQLVALADAGFHAVAVDLRGYGASDKPPRGYDLFTLSADLSGLVRALGEQRADVVGHDWGAALGWMMASLEPALVRRLVVVGMAHPMRLRDALAADAAQRRASGYVFAFQVPRRPERRLVADDAAEVGGLLRAWGGPGFPDEESERRYREAAQIPGVAHSALEYYRWLFRSQARLDGRRLRKALSGQVAAPVLQVHGALDTCQLPATAAGSGRYAADRYEWRLLDGVGHFVPEEAPELLTADLLRWLA